MRRRAIIAVIGVLLASIVVAGSLAANRHSRAAPGAVPDASYTMGPTRPCILTSWLLDKLPNKDSFAAQTFTAKTTGQLTDVSLWVFGNVGSFTLTLTATDTGGLPNLSAPLATTTGTIPKNDPPPPPNPPNYRGKIFPPVEVSFPSRPMVQAGTLYALVITNQDADPGANKFLGWQIDFEASRADPNGAHCAGGTYTDGGAWAKGTGIPDPRGADFFFTTYVLKPPPPPPPKFRVTVVRSTLGSVVSIPAGISCGVAARCAFSFARSVTLVAKPKAGHPLLRWTVNGRPAGKALRLHLTRASRVVPSFKR